MKIYVDLDHVDITEYTQVESGEYNTNKINFIFTPEYKDLVKVAIFGSKLDTDEPKFYKIYLSDDSCYLPSEVTTTSDVISIGVYAFNVDNGELKLRYSPTPVKTIVYEGSFREEAENSSSPTPTEIEQIMSRIISLEEITSDLNTRVEALENKACDLDSIKEDVDELKNNVESISGRLDTAESDIDELEGDIANTYSKTEVDTLLGSKVDTTTFNSSQAAQDEKIAKAELILSQLPKVPGEGTNISLSPTIEYDLDVGYKGDTYQETLTGKNLCETNYLNWEAGEYNISGTKVDNLARARVKELLPVPSNTTIYITTFTDPYKIVLRGYDENKSFVISYGAMTNEQTLYLGQTIKYLGVTIYNPNHEVAPEGQTIITNIQNGSIKPFMCNNTVADKSFEPYCGCIPSPNPYYKIPVQRVTGTQEIEICGKNLFNKSNVTANAYINTSGRLVTGATNYTASAYIKVPTGNITWSATSGNGYSLSIYDKDKNFIRSVGRTSNNAMTISIASGEEYIRFTLLTADLNITQIEIGSSATTYSPYTSQTYTLHLGDLELAKIGDYQDYIYYNNGKWYKLPKINKKIFDGTETGWSSASYGTNSYQIAINDLIPSTTENQNTLFCMSNLFRGVAFANRTLSGDNIIYPDSTGSNYGKLYIRNTSIASLDSFKTLLGTTNLKFYYVTTINEPTEITNTTLLSDLEYIRTHAKSYLGTTNISTSGNLPIIITASALKQLS